MSDNSIFATKITETVTLGFCSDARLEECESLIGKTVKRVDAQEHSFELHFTDGSSIEFSGNRWNGCSLGVSITP